MAFGTVLWFLRWIIFIALFVWIIQYWLTTKKYIFTEEEIASIARKHVGPNIEDGYRKVHAELLKRHPGHILPARDLQWLFLNAGGVMGSVCFLHSSVTEYIAFFGGAMDTYGHSGRHWANVTNTLLTGKIHVWPEGTLRTKSYKAGDTIRHVWGEASGCNLTGGTWTVEYGRGFTPTSIAYSLGDSIFSTQDFVNVFKTFRVLFKAMWLEMSASIAHIQNLIRAQF